MIIKYNLRLDIGIELQYLGIYIHLFIKHNCFFNNI